MYPKGVTWTPLLVRAQAGGILTTHLHLHLVIITMSMMLATLEGIKAMPSRPGPRQMSLWVMGAQEGAPEVIRLGLHHLGRVLMAAHLMLQVLVLTSRIHFMCTDQGQASVQTMLVFAIVQTP